MEDCKLVEDQECTIVDDVELEEVCENMDKGLKISKAIFLSSIKKNIVEFILESCVLSIG